MGVVGGRYDKFAFRAECRINKQVTRKDNFENVKIEVVKLLSAELGIVVRAVGCELVGTMGVMVNILLRVPLFIVQNNITHQSS